MLLYGKYTPIVLVLMDVEIQSYINVCMHLWYSDAYAIVWNVPVYCSSTNARGDTVYTVVYVSMLLLPICYCMESTPLLF